MDLKTQVEGYKTVTAKIEKAKQEQHRLDKQAKTKLEAIIKAVRGGESTGDSMLDLCIAGFGDVLGEKRADIEALLESIVPYPGQMVIVISRYEEQEGCSGFGGSRYPVQKTHYQLGLLPQVPRLSVGTRKYGSIFRASGYTVGIKVDRAIWMENGLRKGWEASEDSILAPLWEVNAWPQIEPQDLDSEQREVRKLGITRGLIYSNAKIFPVELLCGDQAVESWYRRRNLSQELDIARTVLGYDKLTPVLF